MQTDCAQTRPRSRNTVSATTSVVALIAVALAVGAVQGAALPDGMHNGRTILREASTARAVAAAVTAAVRDMVGHDTIDATIELACTDSLSWLLTQSAGTVAWDDIGRSHAPPIAARLLNIPPPTN